MRRSVLAAMRLGGLWRCCSAVLPSTAHTCTWASVRPGMRVRPRRSRVSTLPRRGPTLPERMTSLMRSPSTTTAAPSTGSLPVPSIRNALVRTMRATRASSPLGDLRFVHPHLFVGAGLPVDPVGHAIEVVLLPEKDHGTSLATICWISAHASSRFFVDPKKRLEAWAEIQQMVANEVPWSFSGSSTTSMAWPTGSTGSPAPTKRCGCTKRRSPSGEEARVALIVLTNAFLIDGTGKEPVDGAAVVVEGERIKDVIRSGKVGPLRGKVDTLDLRGRTLMPGLTDAHVHVGVGETGHEGAAPEVEGLDLAPQGADLARANDVLDALAFHHHGGAVDGLLARAVDQERVGQD